MTDASCCVPLLNPGVPETPQLDRLRRAAFTALRTGTAPRLTELAATSDLDVTDARELVGQLMIAGITTIDGDLAGDPSITGAEGLTVETTAHQLNLDGRQLHTWCAFDNVGIPAALAVDAEARTTCPACSAAIRLLLPGGVPPLSPIVGWWPEVTGGPVNETFCPTARLFCERSHLQTWRAGSGRRGELLSLSQLADRGRTTWSLFTDSSGDDI